MIHGCVGPAFFAYTVALAVVTSRFWKAYQGSAPQLPASLFRVALLTAVFVYLQLLIGAQVRHVSVMASPGAFRITVIFHLLMATVVFFHIFQLLVFVLWQRSAARSLLCPAVVLACLIVAQLALGSSTWIVKYGWPDFLSQFSFAIGHTIHAKSFLQAVVVTAHVATGSLILGFAVALLTRIARLSQVPVAALGSSALIMELAR